MIGVLVLGLLGTSTFSVPNPVPTLIGVEANDLDATMGLAPHRIFTGTALETDRCLGLCDEVRAYESEPEGALASIRLKAGRVTGAWWRFPTPAPALRTLFKGPLPEYDVVVIKDLGGSESRTIMWRERKRIWIAEVTCHSTARILGGSFVQVPTPPRDYRVRTLQEISADGIELDRESVIDLVGRSPDAVRALGPVLATWKEDLVKGLCNGPCGEVLVPPPAVIRGTRVSIAQIRIGIKSGVISGVDWQFIGDTDDPWSYADASFAMRLPEEAHEDTAEPMVELHGVRDHPRRYLMWQRGSSRWRARIKSPIRHVYDVPSRSWRWRPSKRSEWKVMELRQESVLASGVARFAVSESAAVAVRIAPVPIKRDSPRYPRLARELDIESTVVAFLTVTNSGRVEEIQILQGHALFESEAIDALSSWKYEAIIIGGQSVTWQFRANLKFTLRRKKARRCFLF